MKIRVFLKTALLVFSFASFAQPDTTQKIITGRTNSPKQQKKPYLILISVDGLRNDYIEKYDAAFLKKMSSEGVRAEYMLPSYPSLTFPNHYTIATGLYPSHHGVVGNYFYDRTRKDQYSMRRSETVREGSWYGGVPLWVLAEQQQMLTASFYWVGTEAAIKGVRPTYYYRYNEVIPIDRRIQVVQNWLKLPEEKRPHFISFYFPEVDHAGHDYGPDAPETAKAVRFVDSAIQKLSEAVKVTGLHANFMVVSDHGMTRINEKETIKPPAVDSIKYVMLTGGEIIQIYSFDTKDVMPLYKKLKSEANHYKVYLKNKTPRRWRYRSKDDKFNRIGDIILVPEHPFVFSRTGNPDPGAHGFDPYAIKDMRASFYAWGPAFKSAKQISGFKNIHVYPAAAAVLDLQINEKIDGKKKEAKKILRK